MDYFRSGLEPSVRYCAPTRIRKAACQHAPNSLPAQVMLARRANYP